MTTKHTPQPWKHDGEVIIHDLDPSPWGACVAIGSVSTENDNWLANARLIAAAPDLLSACCELINGDGTSENLQRAIDVARAAILKATGE